jgi:hypothetical protein
MMRYVQFKILGQPGNYCTYVSDMPEIGHIITFVFPDTFDWYLLNDEDKAMCLLLDETRRPKDWLLFVSQIATQYIASSKIVPLHAITHVYLADRKMTDD